MSETPYARYAANKALIEIDPTLTQAKKERWITELTETLKQEERALGITWVPVWGCEVEATGDGSHELNGDAA